jgi:hypothetical protein
LVGERGGRAVRRREEEGTSLYRGSFGPFALPGRKRPKLSSPIVTVEMRFAES